MKSFVLASLVIAPLAVALSPAFKPSPKYFVPLDEAPKVEVPHSAAPAPAFATLDYFEQKCARCHGNYGANYTDSIKTIQPTALHDVLHDMAAGPGQAPLDENQLEVLGAFHRSLGDGKPFVSITKIEREGAATTLSGEATPNAIISAVQAAQSTLATRDGHNWTLKLNGVSDLSVLKIQAKIGEATNEIAPQETMFSHAAPKVETPSTK